MEKEYKKTAVCVCLIMSAMIAGSVSFGFFMDPVTSDLGFSRGAFSIYFSIVTIVGTVTLPIYGRIMPRVGSRKVVIVGGIWTGLCMAAFSVCSGLLAFYFVAVLVGLGFFGCSYVAAPVIVDEWFVEKKGAVMGAAAAVGGCIGVILGILFPAVIGSLGWRAGYICMGLMVFLLTVPAGVFLLHSSPTEVGLKKYGSDNVAAANAPASGAEGLTRNEALRSPSFWCSALAFLLFAITVSVTQHLAAYFVSVGMTATLAGIMMSVISGGIVITSALVGGISDKIGLAKTVISCSILYALSFVLLPVSGLAIAPVCVALLFMSLGNAYTSIIAPVVTSTIFGAKDYPAIWGSISMACVLGQAVGTPLWGVSFDITGGYQTGMVIAACLNVIGMALILIALRRATISANLSDSAVIETESRKSSV